MITTIRMQVSKQLLINNISKKIELPDDVLNIIKDFCFYDMPTGIMRRFITERRQEICRIFNSVHCISRKNPSELFDNPDTKEHWVFSISNPECVVPRRIDVPYIRHTFVLQLQAVNCSLCGNYSHYSRGTTAQNICRCIDENFDD